MSGSGDETPMSAVVNKLLMQMLRMADQLNVMADETAYMAKDYRQLKARVKKLEEGK